MHIAMQRKYYLCMSSIVRIATFHGSVFTE